MGVRNQMKRFLRRCGRPFLGTVHELLINVERQLGEILDQNTHLAENQTALLQSGIYLAERLPQLQAHVRQLQTDVQNIEAGLASLSAEHRATKLGEHLPEILRQTAAAAEAVRTSAAGLVRLEQEYAVMREWIARLEPVTREARASIEETRAFIEQETVRQVCVETSDYASTNPEVELVSFLYSYLPGRKAMDIGAHVGEVSEGLLKTGYEVYAFEPYPPSYTRLTGRLNGQAGFHPFNLALGAVEAELPLHVVADRTPDHTYDDPTVFHSLSRHAMPEGLAFRETVPVKVKKIASLHRQGIVPADVSFVKIDTEGYDLEVIRGMEDYRYPVVCVEFWDAQIPFAKSGLLYTVESMVDEMRRREYFWYIVLYRIWGRNQIAYFCNHDRPVPESWGNLFFFRDSATFQHAQQWCSAVLPRTYFKPVAATSHSAGRSEILERDIGG